MGRLGNANCNLSINVQAASQWVKLQSLKVFLKFNFARQYLYFIDIAK
jgi:hypothetical protein